MIIFSFAGLPFTACNGSFVRPGIPCNLGQMKLSSEQTLAAFYRILGCLPLKRTVSVDWTYLGAMYSYHLDVADNVHKYT